MLNWIVTFFLFAVITAVFGFGGMSGIFADIAKFLSVFFVVLFAGMLVYSVAKGHRTHTPFL